ncbi:MAG TPA: 4'-phosphopantetheinyl transferase superfamily protein [Polyangiaceae bacterium]|nr:4'-phosphopantetheinyl transferase superfamily protein [Polyangiaceae bacterium]
MAAHVLEGLFGGEVVTVEVDLYRDPIGELTESEALALPRAHPDRLLEYRAGRHCARTALARLGVHGVSILRNEDRSPLWPRGFVGSIAHSRGDSQGWCGAVVARAADARGVGVDGELDEPLERKLWRRILRDSEKKWLEARERTEQGVLGKLIFCAKEATYKCQYAVTKTFLDFADVEVTLSPETSSFRAAFARDVAPFDAGFSFEGKYARRQGLIAAGVVLR